MNAIPIEAISAASFVVALILIGFVYVLGTRGGGVWGRIGAEIGYCALMETVSARREGSSALYVNRPYPGKDYRSPATREALASLQKILVALGSVCDTIALTR